MTDGEPTVVLSVRVVDLDVSMVVPGSVIVDCEQCGAECWLSPATRRTAAGKGWPVWCVQCVKANVDAEIGGADG